MKKFINKIVSKNYKNRKKEELISNTGETSRTLPLEKKEVEEWEKIHKEFGRNYYIEVIADGGSCVCGHYNCSGDCSRLIQPAYQQKWEAAGLTYQDAQEWVSIGFRPEDYYQIKSWVKQGFTAQITSEWLTAGLKIQEFELAKQATQNGHTAQDFANKLQGKRDAQVWVDIFYPSRQRKTTTKLALNHKELTGKLVLDGSEWSNLEIILVRGNQLTELTLINCLNVKKLDCSSNQLNSLNLNDCWKLKEVNFNKNPLLGSLEEFIILPELNHLDLSNTQLNSGLEYLPTSLIKFKCQGTRLATQLEVYGEPQYDSDPSFSDSYYNYHHLLQRWREANCDLVIGVAQIIELRKTINLLNLSFDKKTSTNEINKKQGIERVIRMREETQHSRQLAFTNHLFSKNEEKNERLAMAWELIISNYCDEMIKLEKELIKLQLQA